MFQEALSTSEMDLPRPAMSSPLFQTVLNFKPAKIEEIGRR